MAYNLERLTKEFNEVCANAGVRCSYPIKLNGRLTKTLGRVRSKWNSEEDKYEVDVIEFSKQLLETSTDKSIRDVLMHEAAHVIALVRTGETQGHNHIFKAICAEIGTTNDTTQTKVERTCAAADIYKYSIYCDSEQCSHRWVGGYNRMCPTLKNLSNCYCKQCGKFKLTYIQNF